LAELRESSLLFSLASLADLERERVDRDRVLDAERRRAAELAAIEAEHTRVAEAARRATAERERVLAEERSRREEAARLEGIRLAEVERARAEAHLRSETELAARRERHALELAAAHAGARVRRLRTVALGGGLLAVLATLAVVGFERFVQRPELERRLQGDAERRAANAAEMTKLGGMLAASQEQARKLEGELTRRKDVAPVPAPSLSAAPGTHTRPPRPLTHPIPHPTTRPCGGDPHDPLNPCLG